MSDSPTSAPLGIPTGFGPQGRTGKGAEPPVERVRLTFTKEGALRYIGHLDVVRMWERACRRAKLPLAYTLGFTPHPRLTLAAPLALGVTSEAELMDVYLREALPASEVVEHVGPQLPAGCRIVAATALPAEGPALSSLTRWAQYAVLTSAARHSTETSAATLGSRWTGSSRATAAVKAHSPADEDLVPWRPPDERLIPPEPEPPLPPREQVEEAIARFLAAPSAPYERPRDGKTVEVRQPVLSLGLSGQAEADRIPLEMVLKLDASGAGRPEDVAAVLGLQARQIHRVRIGLEGEAPPALS